MNFGKSVKLNEVELSCIVFKVLWHLNRFYEFDEVEAMMSDSRF